MKYIKRFESIDWDFMDEEIDNDVKVGDIVKPKKGMVYYYNNEFSKIVHYIDKNKRYKVSDVLNRKGEILVKFKYHWPWFIMNYFEIVKK